MTILKVTKSTRLKTKIFIVSLFGFLILLGLFLYGDINKVTDSIRYFNWIYLPFILALAFGNYIIRFLRWEYYLKKLHIRIKRRHSFEIFMVGLFMSISPGKIGELIKSYLLKKQNNIPISRSAPVVIAERTSDFIAILVLTAIGFYSFKYGESVMLAGIILISLFIGILCYPRLLFSLLAPFERIKIAAKAVEMLKTSYRNMFELMKPAPLAIATAFGIVAWFAECLGFYLVLKGLALSFTIFQAIFIYAFATLAGALTMIPGGLIGTEGSMVGLIMILNVSRAKAVSSTILIRICTLWFAVAIGLLFFAIKFKRLIINDDSMDKLKVIKEERIR